MSILEIGPGRVISMKSFTEATPSMSVRFSPPKNHFAVFLLLGNVRNDQFADFDAKAALEHLGWAPVVELLNVGEADTILLTEPVVGSVEMFDNDTVGINATLTLPQIEAIAAKMRSNMGDEAFGAIEYIESRLKSQQEEASHGPA